MFPVSVGFKVHGLNGQITPASTFCCWKASRKASGANIANFGSKKLFLTHIKIRNVKILVRLCACQLTPEIKVDLFQDHSGNFICTVSFAKILVE